ncbi:MAG: DUF4179 domain-containing protein [Lachnospiraceae bacterium]|nr:DUF4179 domain-containing protein [Lachnospiraceae bacterium]
MKEKEIIEKMQQNIVIPNIVQKKVNSTFQMIDEKNKKVITMHSGKRKWKMMWIAVAAAMMVLGTTICAAAYIHLNSGLEAEFFMTQEKRQFLEEHEYMSHITNGDEMPAGVTAGGVTITPSQIISDNRFAWLSFKVEGYDFEEGMQPNIFRMSIIVDGNEQALVNVYSDFYKGRDYDGSLFFYEGGAPEKETNGSHIENYVDEEGNMEYIIQIDGSRYEKGLIGSSVHVTLQDLGTFYRGEFSKELEAVWEFDIELKGSDEIRKVTLSEPLGDSGATVVYAELSPISFYVQYDISETFAKAPEFIGVRLKDGIYMLYIADYGVVGYRNESENAYVAARASVRVIDTSQVDALLFLKDLPKTPYNGEYEWIEENLYIVPIETVD